MGTYSCVPTPPHRIEHQVERPGVIRVCLVGEFDIDNSAELAAALLRYVADPAVERVILDMGGTTFIDSSGIRAVTDAHYAAAQAGKDCRVAGWPRSVRRLFEILELAEALDGDEHAESVHQRPPR